MSCKKNCDHSYMGVDINFGSLDRFDLEVAIINNMNIVDDLNVIIEDVLEGEGVALAAIAGDGLGEAFAGHLPSAAKHHVFEEMRHAGNAGGIIDRADLEPQNLGGDGGAVIGDHQNLQAVCERELEGLAATHVARR